MEKQLGWTHKLGGAEPLLISMVGHTVLARLMESQIWQQPTSSVGGGLKKKQWPLLALMPDTSVSPCIPLTGALQVVTPVLELIVSESE